MVLKDSSRNKVFHPSSGKALAGKGVKVTVYKVRSKEVAEDGKPPKIEYFTEGTENIDIVLDNYTMMMIEEEFQSHQAWLSELSTRPYRTITKTMEIILDVPTREAAKKIIGTSIEEYQYAFIVAWTIAYGAGEDQVGKISSRGSEMGFTKHRLIDLIVDVWGQGMDELTGEAGSTPGSQSEDSMTSSGDEPPTKLVSLPTATDDDTSEAGSPKPKRVASKTQ